MAELTIFKASAGSGKTFRLVLEYLKILINNPYDYRHVLAVTFTKKATAEMKERIIRDLNAVAKQSNSSLIDMLVDETGFGPEKVIENAGVALTNILHNYEYFSISTIDSFFQRVLRSFARESGLYGAYEIELENSAVLEEACDRLLLSVEDDLELRKWILEMTEDRLAQGKSWQVRQQIIDLGNELFKDECQVFIRAQGELETERIKLREFKSKIFSIKKEFEKECRRLGTKAVDLMGKHNASLGDFAFGKASFANFFFKLYNFEVDKLEPAKRFLQAIDNVEVWTSKKGDSALMQRLYNDGLNDIMHEIMDFIHAQKPIFNTAVEISKHLYTLGVLSTLLLKIREIGIESNSLLLSEGNVLLNGIIGDNDAPFIYEKTGNYYNYFMIDEFQDTSVTQWENFRPLVINSLSENNPCLVVGDVKQSIYRWRNGDWQLLNHELKNQLSTFGVKEVSLESNWRSSENIVHFNNLFFTQASKIIQQKLCDELVQNLGNIDDYSHTITDVFSDVTQKVNSGKSGGYVQCAFIEDDEDYQSATMQHLVETIENLQQKGAKAKEIAILVYKNKQGKAVAEALLNHKKTNPEYNFEVISDDSLFIENSPSVIMLTGLMQFIVSPSDKVLQASLVHVFARKILPVLKKLNKLPPRFVLQNAQQQLFCHPESTYSFFPEQVENDYFPFFDNEEFKFIVQKWGNLSIEDLSEELIRAYYLDCLPGEQATLQAFKDEVAAFSGREGGNLHKFVEWWQNFGSRVKVQSAGERDAIRIMTLHKSKGLEFPYVLLPFCDEKFKNNNILWCKTQNTPFAQYPVVPVKSTKALIQTQFVPEYLTEQMMTYIDSLNKLYVAFTRAERALFIFTKLSNDSGSGSDFLLNKILPDTGNFSHMPASIESGKFSLGSLEIIKSDSQAKNEANLSVAVKRKSLGDDTLRLRANYDSFIDGKAKGFMAKINEGKIMHELLSAIVNTNDIESALHIMLNAGKIDADRVDTLHAQMKELLKHPAAVNWFNGSMHVLNETTILSANFGLSRPDRVMIDSNKAIVIDYKASSIIRKEHKSQVQNYCELIKQMGYTKVEGYVWYLNSNNIKALHENFE